MVLKLKTLGDLARSYRLTGSAVEGKETLLFNGPLDRKATSAGLPDSWKAEHIDVVSGTSPLGI